MRHDSGTGSGMGQAYSLQEAADKVGVSKSTIHRLTKRKKNPLSKNLDGKIEPSELARIYPDAFSGRTDGTSRETSRETSRGTTRHGSGTVENDTENAILQVKLDAAEKLAAEREAELHHRDVTIGHLRSELDEEKRERREAQTKLTALLSDMRPAAPEKPVEARRVRPVYLVVLAVVLAAVAASVAVLYLQGGSV